MISTKTILTKSGWTAGVTLVAAMCYGLTASPALADDVTMFDHPPSVGELEAALLKPKMQIRTRSIVIGGDTSTGTTAPAEPKKPSAIGMPINFDLNSAVVLPDAKPYIESIAGLLNKDGTVRLLVEGHTDVTGTHEYNMNLSRERAATVKDVLVHSYGIAANRLDSVGLGPDDPLNGVATSDPKNRRVQFRLE